MLSGLGEVMDPALNECVSLSSRFNACCVTGNNEENNEARREY